MSMRLRTTLLIILIVFVSTATTFVSGLYFTGSSLKKTLEQDLGFAIGIANSLVGLQMNLKKAEAIAVAARLSASVSPEELAEDMREQMGVFPDISALSVFDRNGQIASHSVPAHDHDLNVRDEYLEKVYGGGTIMSSPFYCSTKGEFVINVYTPMRPDRILAMTIPGLTFTDMLAKHRLWQSGDVFMLNEEGTFIGGVDREIVLAMANYITRIPSGPDSPYEEVGRLIRKILAADKGVDSYVVEGVEHLCAYSRIDDSLMGWRVAISVPLAESPRADAMRGQAYAAILFLLIGVASAFFLSRVTDLPFRRIESQNRDLEKLNATILAQADSILEEHERVRIMLDATPLVCRLWRRDFTLIDCNDAAVKLYKLKDKQEYLDRYFELSPEYQPDGQETRARIRQSVSEAFEKGSCTYQWMYRMPDGTPIPTENTMVRVPYGGEYVVAAYSRDLREHQKMIAEIEQRDALLQTVNQAADILLRSGPEDFADVLRQCMGMMARSIDADRMYLCKNHLENGRPHYTQMYEWSEKVRPFQDTGMTSNIPYDETTLEIRETMLRGECAHRFVRATAPSDRERLEAQGILSILLVPVFIRNDFWGFVGFDNCHSERLFSETEESVMRSGSMLIANALLRNENMLSIREASAKLESALADAKEANKAKSVFLAHMSHEIRTPLNAVIGLSELTLDEENLSREAGSNMEKIYNAGSTILSIVNDILDISKIESGKFELNPVRYDTPSLINDTVTLNIVRIQEKPVIFTLYVDENLPGELYGDDLRVKQVFNNLLSNAFKYTNAGSVEWRLSFERRGEDILLVSSVRDTGIGIRPEDMRRLFSDYHQLDMKTNRRVDGTGLGLAITKRLVEMMDGSLTVTSEYGKGATFRVRMRQTPATDLPIGAEVASNLMNLRYTLSKRSKNTKLVRLNMSYARVLVVDDIETNLDVAKGMMKPYAMKIDCAGSGQRAVDLIRAENPRYSAIFMDHMMPGMDGVEATRIIREEIGTEYARDIPIIALTANAVAGNEEMFLRLGFQAFISKPIDITKLDAVLRRWVRDKSLEKELHDAGEAPCPPDTGEDDGSVFAGISIDGLDKYKVLERFGGSGKVFVSVLRSCALNVRPLLRRLREYLEADNLTDYGIVVHGIKGACYTISALEVGKAAEELEMAAKNGDLQAVRAAHGPFEQAAKALLDDMDRALAAIDAVTDKPAAAEPEPALLDELRKACGAFDMDRVDAAMERLESFSYARGEKCVAWLREQVNDMAFENIVNGEWPSL